MKDIFTREKTWQIKGVAILLMLAHHLFAFSNRFYKGYEVNSFLNFSGYELPVIIGLFGKICVSIFMFLGGYGLYKTFQKENFINKIINLYKKYWKTFLIFIPIGFIFFKNQNIYTEDISLSLKFSEFNYKNIIFDFLGLTSNLNGEWWFFKNYLFAVFTGYIFINIMKKNTNFYKETLIIIIWYVLTNGVFSYYANLFGLNNFIFSNLFIDNGYSIIFLIGVLFSKYKIFNKFSEILIEYNNLEKFIISIIGILLVIYTRVFYIDISLDILLTPVFILFSYNLINIFKKVSKIFEYLGKNSTNMWLNHSFFCYYYWMFAKAVYYFNNPLITFIILLALSLASSILTDFVWQLLSKIYYVINKKRCN